MVGKLTQYWNYDQKREVYFNNLNILIVGQYERERERTRRVKMGILNSEKSNQGPTSLKGFCI